MPDSLKWVAGLLLCAVLAASASLYVQHVQGQRRSRMVAAQLTGGDPVAGQAAMSRYGCVACHQRGQVQGVQGQVGPSLKGVAVRPHIAGRLGNSPQELIRWVRFPQEIAPGGGMPDLGVSQKDARDIAAYLYTLR